jgi:hypothetical protein
MKKSSPPFATSSNDTAFYDIVEDYELIEASFAQQYGIRLRRENDMEWGEFLTLLAGLNGETPLGYVVSIRSEKDRERIKNFTAAEKKIRNDWAIKHRRVVTDTKERDAALSGFLAVFKEMAQKGG